MGLCSYFIFWIIQTQKLVGGGEMLPTLVVGWRASAVRGEEAGCFREVAGMSIVAVGSPHSTVDTFSCRQPSGLNK